MLHNKLNMHVNLEKESLCLNKPRSRNGLGFSQCVSSLMEKIKQDVFFIQERHGKDGVPFKTYKIRTMKHGAHTTPPHSVKNGKKEPQDPRLIPSRKWMRKVGVDEIPQIINILKGEMSFFGARPLDDVGYQNLPPHRKKRRNKYKPGVFGGYAFALKDEKVRHDIFYLQDLYLRLRYIKEKQGRRAVWGYHTYVLVKNIEALLKGVNR